MTRSEYFLAMSVAFIFGVLVGSYYAVEVWMLLFAEGIAGMLFFVFRREKIAKIILLLMIVLAGSIRISSELSNDANAMRYHGLKEGENAEIYADAVHVERTKNNTQEVLFRHLRYERSGEILPGKLIAYYSAYPAVYACNTMYIEGKIYLPQNFDGFDYKTYLASKDIHYIMYYPVSEIIARSGSDWCKVSSGIRKFIYDLNKKIYPEPQSGIMNALLIGIETDIGDDVIDAFNKTGTRHLLAISGFNITIIAIILMHVLLSLGIRRDNAFYIASLGIIFYIMIIESSSSSIRAGIMGELTLIAYKLGRISSAANAIVFAACLMLLENPYLLRYDIGFQLSFLAVMGLIFIYPKFDKLLSGLRDIFGMKTIFMATMCAQIATFPILLYNFGNISLLSVISNMLILPFAVPVMIGGFAISFIGTFSLYFGRVLSWPIWLMIEYQLQMIKYMSTIDILSIKYEDKSNAFIIAYYAALTLILCAGTFMCKIFPNRTSIKKISNS